MEERKVNVFWNKNYVLLFLGALVSNVGFQFYHFAVSFYILEITDNNAFIQGVYLAVSGLVYVLFLPIGGVLADRWNKVRIVYITDYVRGLIVILGAVSLLLANMYDLYYLKLVTLFVIAIVFDFVAAIFRPAVTALLRYIVTDDELQQASSYMSSMDSLVAIVGILLAGILYSVLPVSNLFVLIGICYILSALSEMFIRYNHVKNENPLTLKYIINDFSEGFRYMITKKSLLSICLGALFVNFFITPSFNSLSYFIRVYVAGRPYIFDHIIEPEFWASLVSISVSLGSIFAGIVYGMKKQPEKFAKSIIIGFVLLSIVFILMTANFFVFVNQMDQISYYLISLLICMLALGVSLILVNVSIATYRYKTVDPDKLAKVDSLMNIGSQGLIPVAAFLGGVVLSNLGYGYILIFSTIGAIGTTCFLVFNKYVRQI